ncbi:MAG: NusG domain II-containing protein [Pseudomonadota bacterium]
MTVADRLLLGIVLLIIAGSFYFAWQPSTAGTHMEIYQGNILYKQYDLHQHVSVQVSGELGDSVIEIDHGRARFRSSPCNSQFCVHAGWQQQSGDVIACLPNGIHIQIHGGESRFDALTF